MTADHATTARLAEINDATGYANGDLFRDAAHVREYFTPAEQRLMFGEDAITDPDTLAEWAETVIESGDHMIQPQAS